MPSRNTVRGILGLVLYAGLLFGGAGTFAWLEGWIFYAWNAVAMTLTGLWLKRRDPALYAERIRPPFQPGQPWWDRVLLIAFIPAWIAWFLLPGMDAVRFSWSHVTGAWRVAGGALHVAGWLGIVWTLATNTYLAPVVRLQSERAHRVIDSGPYALVRHPMYLAVFVWMLGGSLLLASWWTVLLCAWPIALLSLRAVLEERHLRRELAGYGAYMERVRFRLVPGVW